MGNIALGVTILVSISRVVAGLHWPGDILAGWILGILLALMFFEFRKYIIKYIVSPLYYLAKLIRLV
jgi:undecaprenyl-diphosphatase